MTVWCAINGQTVVGPYFFEDVVGETLTVNQQNYRAVLKKFLNTIRRRGYTIDEHWFQQDGATPHVANDTLVLLGDVFAERIISRKTQHNWAAQSPDMT